MDAEREQRIERRGWPMIITLLTGLSVVTAVLAEGPQEEAAGKPVPVAAATRRPRLVVTLRNTGQHPAVAPPTPTIAEKRIDPPAGTGIHLFPPPGTSPPKAGIIVPEDFDLPPGYVRHNQTTDDGKSLRAILVFHPDYDVVDENGGPVAIPEDRVVPPAMAPPGLPIESLNPLGETRRAK